MIGIAGAVGACGGLLLEIALRQASLGVTALVKRDETQSRERLSP